MRSIWAVATNTVKQALRLKIAAAFIIMVGLLLPVMGLTMEGDGTLKGRLQTFISYSFSLTAFMLCILTIVVSTYSLTSDIKQKQIFTVITKPIRRFQFILGKLLGVILLDIILLIPFYAIIYSITTAIPRFAKASSSEIAQVRDEFFTARASIIPKEPDVEEEIHQIYQKLESSGQIEQHFRGSTKEGILAELRQRTKLRKRAVPPGHALTWQFNNIKPLDPNGYLFIRFKYDVSRNPADLKIYGKWVIGDDRQIKYATGIKTPIYPVQQIHLIRTPNEIKIPIDAVANDGYLAVTFQNDPQLNVPVVIFPFEDGLEVLYKADSFLANYIRAVLIIFCRLIFLACLGVLASTFLTFPVAILFCFAIFFAGTISGFTLESFDYLGKDASWLYSYTLRPIVTLLPRLDKFSPAKFLVPARLLSYPLLGKIIAVMVFIKSTLILIFAVLLFHRKELARIVV
ncbi:MAG: ABC transporter permease [Planctomycetota bacterium]|jgi:hypothetical protein